MKIVRPKLFYIKTKFKSQTKYVLDKAQLKTNSLGSERMARPESVAKQ